MVRISAVTSLLVLSCPDSGKVGVSIQVMRVFLSTAEGRLGPLWADYVLLSKMEVLNATGAVG